MSTTHPLLSARDLDCVRGGVPVLTGVTLTLSSGDALVLRGPNGSGKTTLLRTLAGLQPPASGQVDSSPDSIAYAGHSDGVKSTLSVVENLEFWAQIFGTDQTGKALAAFDLEHLKSRLAGHLSAGQLRRLGLARMLVTGRPVWIMDEPTVSLDEQSVSQFGDAVRDHCRSGGAAIIATHIALGFETTSLDVTQFAAVESETTDAFEEVFL